MDFLIPLSYPRSGSTVIQRVLNTSDDVFISGEKLGLINSIYSFIKNMEYMKYDLPEIFNYLEVDDDRNPAFHANHINIEGLKFDLIQTITTKIISPPKNKKIIGWKENFISPYELGDEGALDLIKFTATVFPNCKFLINIRNPEITAESTVWKLKTNSLEEITKWREWLVWLHTSSILGNNKTCLLNHDDWSKNKDFIIDKIINFGININIDKSNKILDEELVHLKDWQI
jgi:hypothetical protein